MKIKKSCLVVLLMSFIAVNPAKELIAQEAPPWASNVIWYQIFVERFYNGNPDNDPTPQDISVSSSTFPVPYDWTITPWTMDWWKQEPWAEKTRKSHRETVQHRRYGGDLQGVIDKLPYLHELGITAIYFNPLNDAPSLHKYDARNYHHIDVNFGPDPEGDKKIIASENPSEPSTWKWTAADRQFLELIEKCHKMGIRIIMDYSWNHTGVDFWAWKDVLQNQEKSPYKDWYEVISFDNSLTPQNEFQYRGWANVASLPEWKKVDLSGPRTSNGPYEGNLNPAVKEHIFAVSQRWLAPNGDTAKGIDGFRLDVAEQIPLGFWRDYRKWVKSIKPNAYLVGEIWWEKWPDKLMDPKPYVNEEIFDAVMFYKIYAPARSFFVQGKEALSSSQLADSLQKEWANLPKNFRFSQMNVNATHDSPRLLTCFANKGKYKYHVNPYENPQCITGKPDEETYKRVRLYLIHQFTIPGSPSIWNGDEMGMWGSDDPDNRKPLWWPDMKFEPETRTNIQPGPKLFDQVEFDNKHYQFYKQIIHLRKNNSIFATGNIEFIPSNDKVLAYRRWNSSDEVFIYLNADTLSQSIRFIQKGKYLDLLAGEIVEGDSIKILPLTGLILRKIK